MDANIEDILSFLPKSDTIAGSTDQIEEKKKKINSSLAKS